MSPAGPALDPDSALLWRDFRRALEAARTSAAYRDTIGYAVASLHASAGKPLAQVTTADFESWLIALADAGKARSTVQTYYRHARRLLAWAADRDMLDGPDPAARTQPPQGEEKLIPVIADEVIAALLATCRGRGKSYRDKRDEAILRVLAESGPRASEVCGLALADVDLSGDVLLIRAGKWARDRIVPFGPSTGLALSAALRARPPAASRQPDAPAFCGCRAPHEPLTRSGIRQIVARRCRLAGVPAVYPHQLRHAAVSAGFSAGMTERDAMKIYGWVRSEMCKRYGEEAAGRVAVANFRQLATGERFR